MALAVLVVIIAYLIGSIPSGVTIARKLAHVDIRQYGSGNVGLANVWQSVSRWALIPVLVVDVGKGAVAVMAAQWLDFSLAYQMLCGLAAIAGHNWSVFLGFKGGRGVGASFGVLLVLAPREALVFFGIGLLGVIFRNVPLGVIIAFSLVPLSAWGLGEPLPVILGCLGILALIVAKRLLAGGYATVPSGERQAVAINRLLFDRDIRDRRAWIKRSPGEGRG